MEFYFVHLMPWPHRSADSEGPARVKCPNRDYDRTRGHDVYGVR